MPDQSNTLKLAKAILERNREPELDQCEFCDPSVEYVCELCHVIQVMSDLVRIVENNRSEKSDNERNSDWTTD